MDRMALASLDELRAMGVEVTVCPSRKAKGVVKQRMRSKMAGLFRVGGSKPAKVRGGTVEEALAAA